LKRKKYNGHTLIELMIVISIIGILLASYTMSSTSYNSYLNSIDVKYGQDSILAFITNAKQYCREKERSGFIVFNTVENQISFYSESKLRDRLPLPGSLSLYGVNTTDSRIHIDNKGFTADACTIKFRDKKGKMHSLTLCVGTAYVEIQD